MNQDRYHPYTTLEMELLGIVGNDYESLHTIRTHYWDDEIPLPPVGEMIRSLRELQRKSWVQCYRYVIDPQEFVPLDDFGDEEAANPIELTTRSNLWWLITEEGLAALKAESAYLDARDPREVRTAECGVAAQLLEAVAEKRMSVDSAIAEWPLTAEREWPRVAYEALGLLERLAPIGRSGDQLPASYPELLEELRRLSEKLKP